VAIFAFTDARIEINAVVASTWAKKVTLDVEVEDLDSTTFGGGGWKALLGGLKSGTVSVDLNQDFAASQVDATLWPLLGTLFVVKIRPTSAAISVTNPEFSGSVLLNKYSPLDGSVGDLAETSIALPTSGTWARATT
jgi:predicted secreted protein